jgi:N-acetylmuramoyl-L-alanine amidase
MNSRRASSSTSPRPPTCFPSATRRRVGAFSQLDVAAAGVVAARRSQLPVTPLTALALLVLGGCATTPRFGRPGEPLPRAGDEIVVCGQLVHTGAPVVLWFDPGGYDAYRAECRFIPNQDKPTRPVSDSVLRYDTFRRHVPEDVREQIREHGWTLPLLQEYVDLFVIHYDACGTSRRCFEVLQDLRGLSVHFMLDVDGTIYQTLDLKERAWHAGTANDRSVGIEIANIGAYSDTKTLEEWYALDCCCRPYIRFPASVRPDSIRTPDFVARPARPEIVCGEINGRQLYQYDLTEAQYRSLIKLTAALCRALPRIRPDYPRDETGALRTTVLTPEELAGFSGLVGHFHITDQKVDPGPAFQWDRLIAGVRRELRR